MSGEELRTGYDALSSEEWAELRADPRKIHLYDAHRIVELLALAAPSTPEPSGLRAAIEALPTQLGWNDDPGAASHWVDRAAVLALLDGPAPSTEPALDGLRAIIVDVLGDALDGYGDPESWADVILARLAESQP